MESALSFIKDNTYIVSLVTFFLGFIFSYFGLKYKDRLAAKSHSLEQIKLLLEAVKVDLEIQSNSNHDKSFLNQICLIKAFEQAYGISMSYEGLKALSMKSNGPNAIEEFEKFGDVLVFDKAKSVFIKQMPVLVNEKLMFFCFWARSFTPNIQRVCLFITCFLFIVLGAFTFVDVLTETQKYPNVMGLIFSIFSGLLITFGVILFGELINLQVKYSLVDELASDIPYENRYVKIKKST